VRSARQRAGWSRETLAHRSGLSFGAISQIESGRRQQVQLGTLLAVADALGVSVDYLVGAATALSPRLLDHTILVYQSDDELLASALPFIAEGIERSEAVLVVSGEHQVGLLRDSLGDGARHVEFTDWLKGYGSPGATLDRYRTFIRDRYDSGAPWVRILGEPVWAGRSDVEVEEWARYEAIINLSLASAPATIVCPYDARSVPDGVLAGAGAAHPRMVEAGEAKVNAAYREPESLLLAVG
jgi:transcriptional regulator with XRE-family HTH domain